MTIGSMHADVHDCDVKNAGFDARSRNPCMIGAKDGGTPGVCCVTKTIDDADCRRFHARFPNRDETRRVPYTISLISHARTGGSDATLDVSSGTNDRHHTNFGLVTWKKTNIV